MILIVVGAALVLGSVIFLLLWFRSPARRPLRPALAVPGSAAYGEEMVRALETAYPDILVLLDEKGVVLDCRGPTLTDLNRSPEWFIGKPLTQTIPPNLASEILEKIATLSTPSEVYVLERVCAIRNVNRSIEVRIARVDRDRFLAIVRM